MLNFLKYLLKTTIYWLLLFALYRLLFIIINLKYAGDAIFSSMASSFWVGVRLDLSLTGYVLAILCLAQSIGLFCVRKFTYKIPLWINYFFIILFTIGLLSNIGLYNYWGKHLDADALSFLKTPWVVIASLRWYEIVLFPIIALAAIWLSIKIFRRIANEKAGSKSKISTSVITGFATLLCGGLMIIPIRGSFGAAPINTGVAYFSSHAYANHAAMNPLWNLFYSLKRHDARTHHYSFMAEEKAIEIFNDMTSSGGNTQIVLNTDRPNIVVILLESFSAQVVGNLIDAPPCGITSSLDAAAREGILFSNIYAASVRSDKGLVATIAGYQVVPSYSITQYPDKMQSLSFFPGKLKEAGYTNMTYIYGGDIKFKGMSSLVTLAGFDKIIDDKYFPKSTQARKWGVYDEFAFERLLDEMTADKDSPSPWLKFLFTLSSHEPFEVPMEKAHDDPYVNSVIYTDRCLGKFFDGAKARGLWDNTLFVLIADHGVPGPLNANTQMIERFHIPMVWTGGAVAAKDTVISKIGSQTDLSATLLNQLGINSDEFLFSKNILDDSVQEFAFFDYPDAFGMITPDYFYVFDNNVKDFVSFRGNASALDSIKGKAYLQAVSADHIKR